MQLIYLIITGAVLEMCFAGDDGSESDGDASRKILGSSVVTSVSVVLDTGNKKNAIFTDAVGKPQPKPSHPSELASPIDLLNPDRFEFYTFDDNGDLVKRLMTLDEIKRFIATGGDTDVLDLDSFTSQGFLPEKRVSDVVTNVQSVIKDEMEFLKDPIAKPIFDTPDVSDSWSMILPAVFGNSGEDIKPEKPTVFVTPDTVMLEPTTSTTNRPSATSTTPVYYSSSSPAVTTSTQPPVLNVEIISNGASTTLSATEKVTPKQETSTKPTRVPITSTMRPPLIRRNDTRPTTSQWSTTSFQPSSTHLTTVSIKTPPTTQKPDFIPNIFGLPQELATSKRPTTAKPSLRPISNIFGMPVDELKNNPRPVSTTPKPTTAFGTSSSKINIRPQLITSSTIGNVYSTKTTTTKPKTTTWGAIQEDLPTSSSKINVRPQLITSSTIGNVYSTKTTTKPKTTTWETIQEDLPSSSSKINVRPQLITSSTIGNVYSTKTTTTKPKTTTWGAIKEDMPLFNIFKEVLNPTTIAAKTSPSTSTTSTITEDSATDSATINNVLNFESSKIQTTENVETTTVTDKIPTTTVIQETKTTLLPPLLNSLNDNQKVSASELLDQLLFTTNIYEINTELDSSKMNLTEVSTNAIKTETTTASDQDLISYPPTTDISLMQSIEQLLSQAVGDVENVFNQTTATTINNPSSYAVFNLSKEGETDLTTPTTTTDQSETTTSKLDVISDSMGAIISQIAAENAALDKFTEVPDLLGVTNRRNDPTTLKNTDFSTTTMTEQQEASTITSTIADATQTETVKQESTTYYYVIRADANATTEETLQLLNASLLSNQNRTKPAKADLSLEQEIIAEELRNMTLLQAGSTTATEHLDESESSMVSISSSTLNSLVTESTEDYTTETTTELDSTESTTNVKKILNEVELLPTTDQPQPSTTTRPSLKPSIVITINENNTIVTESGKLVANKTITKTPEKNTTQDQTWTLVSTLAPQQASSVQNSPAPTVSSYPDIIDTPVAVDLVPKPMQGFGLEESTSTLDVDVHQFVQLCNELAFGFWKTVTTGLSPARSIFVSPFAASSMLAMVFLGAKGATSEEMNEILKLDDMVTFNPHLIFKSVSESITNEPNSGVATAAIIRELFSDRSKGKLLDFYKNRVKAFYDGFAEEVSYREIGDVIRRRSNMLVKKYTNGKYPQFLNDASITARSPLSGVSINIFETDCSQTSSEGRDGELHFIIYPSMKQRRLVPVPAVVYKSGFLAGYEPSLDATAVALGSKDQTVSTLLVVPGQQGIAAPGDGLARLEKRLVESSFKKGAWSRLLRSLIPRPGLEIQIPRFSHRSVINATTALQRMGLHELFNPNTADLRGLNGVANELHLSDVLQINKFATCGEKRNDDTEHSEVYPATTMRARAARRLLRPINPIDFEEPRDYQRAFHDPLFDPRLFELPLSLRPRQARIPDVPRLRFDRPFLYFVRHNPTGLILHMGRFNPRLLP